MAELLGIYEQKPPRLTALQWDGSRAAAAWIVAKFGGTMFFDPGAGPGGADQLRLEPPGAGWNEIIPVGTWFAEHPQQGVVRYTEQEFTDGWEFVQDAPADQQPVEPEDGEDIETPSLEPEELITEPVSEQPAGASGDENGEANQPAVT